MDSNKKYCFGCFTEIHKDVKICAECGFVQGSGARGASQLKPGTMLNKRYLVGRAIGSGGFGVTYLGFDTTLSTKIAIKEYFPREYSTRIANEQEMIIFDSEKAKQYEAGKEKFIEEAQRLADIRGTEGVVSVFDVFEQNKTAYLIMEFLEGKDLGTMLTENDGVLEYKQAKSIMKQLLEILQKVHENGMIHRDISPDNVFVLKDGKIKLIDFGAARYATSGYSKPLTAIIKPGYAPEEQYCNYGQGAWTDTYAAAATFYRMITGRVPVESRQRGIKETLKLPSQYGVKIPRKDENVLMNALNVNKEYRFQTAKDFEEALFGENDVERIIIKPQKKDLGIWPVWLKAFIAFAGVVAVTFGVLVALKVIDVNFEGISSSQTYSLDESTTVVPKLQNLSLSEAEKLLAENDIDYKIIGKEYSTIVAKDNVVSQVPAHGTEINTDVTQVELVLSNGSMTKILKDYTGEDYDRVSEYLTKYGYIVNQTEYEEDTNIQVGCIVSQSVEAGTSLPVGNKIVYAVSTGKSSVGTGSISTGNYIGSMFTTVLKQLDHYDIYVSKKNVYSDIYPKGTILSQSLQAGLELKAGDNIEFEVSAGRRPSVTPYVINDTWEEACAVMNEEGIVPTFTLQMDDSVLSPTSIIEQKVYGGTELPIGTEVELIVKAMEDKMRSVTEFNNIVLQLDDGTIYEIMISSKNKGTNDDYLQLSNVVSIYGYDTFFDKSDRLEEDQNNFLALMNDGTVYTQVNKENWTKKIADWQDIVSLDLSTGGVIGLKSDGTVETVGYSYEIDRFTDMIGVAAGGFHVVGLRMDGTVLSVVKNESLVNLEVGQCRGTAGWKDIVQVDAGYQHTVGLTGDGKVLAVGRNNELQCEVSDWTDIVAISTGLYHTVGLRADGTVVATGKSDRDQCAVSSWSNIVAIKATNEGTIGINDAGEVFVAANYY